MLKASRTSKFLVVFSKFTMALPVTFYILRTRAKHLQEHIKGNPKFQDILNWILQILHYYCGKQHKNIKNSRIVKQNLVLYFPFSLFIATCASCHLPQQQNFFISWTKYDANFKCHKWSFVLYIVLFFGLKMIFIKYSNLDITACIKNCVCNNFKTSIYIVILCLQLQNVYKSLICEYFCTNI